VGKTDLRFDNQLCDLSKQRERPKDRADADVAVTEKIVVGEMGKQKSPLPSTYGPWYFLIYFSC
jgi:hypothetical protein